MKNTILLGFLFLISSCPSGTAEADSDSDPNACTTTNGYYCKDPSNSDTLTAITPGTCAASTDCPPQLGSCAKGACIPANNMTYWFATDPIRPGVTINCNGVNCSNSTDYIYNIMAKGYASLDDWCMSQAQQSIYKTARNIKSWTAMIIAQPNNEEGLYVQASTFYRFDTDPGVPKKSTASAQAAIRVGLYLKLLKNFTGSYISYLDVNTSYYSVDKTRQFAANSLAENYQMYDKHGNVTTEINYSGSPDVINYKYVFGWSGLGRFFIDAALNRGANESNTNDCSEDPLGYAGIAGYVYNECSGIGTELCVIDRHTQNRGILGDFAVFSAEDLFHNIFTQGLAKNSSGNSWADYGEPSQSPNYGALAFGLNTFQPCGQADPISFGSSPALRIPASAVYQNPVICISNASE